MKTEIPWNGNRATRTIPIYTLVCDQTVIAVNDRKDIEYKVRKLMEEYEKWELIVNT
jgi:hypothetical protein